MFTFLAVILILLWLFGGFAIHVGGDFIHLLLLLAIIAFVYDFLVVRRRNLP